MKPKTDEGKNARKTRAWLVRQDGVWDCAGLSWTDKGKADAAGQSSEKKILYPYYTYIF